MKYGISPGGSLCDVCKWAKDKENVRNVKACYCTEYGIIIAHRKERCTGFEVRKQENRD